MRIGVISDTHGLLRPEALEALAGVEHILHAGDVGDPKILDALKEIAPITAIRGNVDVSGACSALPATEAVELGGKLFYIVHSIHDLDLNPKAAQIDVVVSGHTHKPIVETKHGVMYLNPGSAGPRRFSLPISLALVTVNEKSVEAQIIELPVQK
ncbi:metallophosphoesterase family protein [Edaphobacter albus]|uniref:metallophosphoesterase family protein n=1 Tax=Edaphobacter sp. 4G125 TaxID=2763071 RepID=UPI0016491176|nr:metallophosphoesterase family protein [Edaphobacter sp. 4G125]QNI38227.1 metallophosphoesterase family protein [Edaphobacter sp. 4G125]